MGKKASKREEYNSFEYANIKHKLFNRFLVIGSVVSFLNSILCLVNHSSIISFIIAVASSILCIILYKLSTRSKNHIKIQIFYFAIINIIIIPIAWFVTSGSIGPMPLYALMIITLSMAFIEKLWIFIFPLISLIEVILLLQYERYYPEIIQPYSSSYSRLYDLSTCFIVISIILCIVFWTINNFIEKEHKILYELSVTDQLTKLYNRRFIIDSMEAYINLAERKQREFSILLIDINNFKALNDIYGHVQGDRVLAHIGKLLLNNSRSYDICGRYGGDEFMVIMPKAIRQDSIEFAERVLLLFNEFAKEYPKVNLSFCYGISEYLENDMDTIISKADEDLYNMKKNKC